MILVGLTLAPTVADQVFLARSNGSDTSVSNVTGSSSTILSLVTLFYVLGVAVVAMGLATLGLRKAGIM